MATLYKSDWSGMVKTDGQSTNCPSRVELLMASLRSDKYRPDGRLEMLYFPPGLSDSDNKN